MKSFKQWLIEDYGPRPIVKHTFKSNSGDLHHFEIHHPHLKDKVQVLLHRTESVGSGHAHVAIGGDHGNAGKMGPAHNRYVLGRIRHHVPGITHIYGHRVTGARSKLSKSNTEKTTVKIDHIKPIPPD